MQFEPPKFASHASVAAESGTTYSWVSPRSAPGLRHRRIQSGAWAGTSSLCQNPVLPAAAAQAALTAQQAPTVARGAGETAPGTTTGDTVPTPTTAPKSTEPPHPKPAPTTPGSASPPDTGPTPPHPATTNPDPQPAAPPPSVGGLVCPVAGPNAFGDSWGDPRLGGRHHEGVDMMSPQGTPLVAVIAGTATMKTNALGGNTVGLKGSDGNYYYYAHLSAWEGPSRTVNQGDVIGYVGHTGDTTANHLHFGIYAGGGPAINPYLIVRSVC